MNTKILLTVLFLVLFGIEYFIIGNMLYDTTSIIDSQYYNQIMSTISIRIFTTRIVVAVMSFALILIVWITPTTVLIPYRKDIKNDIY